MPQDSRAQSSIAFRRDQAQSTLFVVALRKFPSKSHGEDTLALASETIQTGGIVIPRGSWCNLLTDSTFFSNGDVPAERLFEGLPAMVLRNSG
jgi:maltooligosyltrehalose synthase